MTEARRQLIAGNWKMNAGAHDGVALAANVAKGAAALSGVDVVVAPPFTALAAVAHELADAGNTVGLAAQNVHPEPSGAFTGEISVSMLKACGATWVILGHSERRQLFGETDDLVARKVAASIAADLRPIVCVGETLAEREAGQTLAVVERQTRAFLDEIAKDPGYAVIAYEPVWAIGTGVVASPADAQEVHAAIRRLLGEASDVLATETRILYGGSVKADNAAGLLSQADIDGALVGGASLDAAGFVKIVAAAQALAGDAATPSVEGGGEANAPAGEASSSGGADPEATSDGEREVAPAPEEAGPDEQAGPDDEAEPDEEAAH